MEIKINDLGSIREAARQFIAQIGEHKVFAFYGSMGAGLLQSLMNIKPKMA